MQLFFYEAPAEIMRSLQNWLNPQTKPLYSDLTKPSLSKSMKRSVKIANVD
jgi:hypothetical protein